MQEFNTCSIVLVMDIISAGLMNRMSVFTAPGNILPLAFRDSTSHDTEINISQGHNTHQTNACGRPVNTWLKDWWNMMAVGRQAMNLCEWALTHRLFLGEFYIF